MNRAVELRLAQAEALHSCLIPSWVQGIRRRCCGSHDRDARCDDACLESRGARSGIVRPRKGGPIWIAEG